MQQGRSWGVRGRSYFAIIVDIIFIRLKLAVGRDGYGWTVSAFRRWGNEHQRSRATVIDRFQRQVTIELRPATKEVGAES